MDIVRRTEELRAALAQLRARVPRVAFVPTMGALHAGHLALVAEGLARADAVVASVFVNPTQFAPGEDFDRYPRQEEADARALAGAGCALLFAPTVEEIYPPGFATSVSVAGLSDAWEGKARPGHFTGVATVVTRLLLLVRPDVALFGEKDWQQLVIVRRLVADLALPVHIVGVPTVRDADGLALSSRNAYLSCKERRIAVALPQVLQATAERIEAGTDVAHALAAARSALEAAGFSAVDYVALVDPETLRPLARLDRPGRLLAAARLGSTRLLDNWPVGSR
ncbi:MAG: pantoate--beta-alanine ligase [Sphingomonadaceae bacterium]|uniref:pantoate--beta-alanine ligase n=1 Tax=Thermaurantiacus sp. TaxID=2820283 RepID=UPI00298EE820|nr:pantoate--beta-alanine ligase [Thermaurantiacus sp.]MCS6986001.1 pantoate--beta-alanine ligase [Sphingomonadaceae bacterium]MDW8414783.1 pantoate--beta-alanine ligase [Thermaurantiacus sp.]